MYVLVVAIMFFSTMGLYLTSLISSAFLASGMVEKRFAPAGLGMYVHLFCIAALARGL
jgi:hypothetical protein